MVMIVVLVCVFANVGVSKIWAQAANAYDQLIQLKLNQPLPESLQKQAESVSKRGDKQTYYFLSGNYVYPHFIETQHGLVVHVAVYLDKSKTAEYTQKLQAIGSPEIVLQNTENESVFGFPTKGVVFVVNNQKQPVVYEWMQPRTEREIVQTYDTETVLAAADSIETTADPRELLLKYPAEVVAIAVGFYTTIISNPKLAVVVVGFIIALVITFKIIRAVKAVSAQHRESRITQLMEETRAINRQRELAATVAETVLVPTQHLSDAPASAPVFDVTTVESAPVPVIVESSDNTSSPASLLTPEEVAAAASAYAMPADEELHQMEQHNPQLRSGEQNLEQRSESSLSDQPLKPNTSNQVTSATEATSAPVTTHVSETAVESEMASKPESTASPSQPTNEQTSDLPQPTT